MKPLDRIVRELKRELAFRIKVYPQWKREGRLTQLEATERIECLEDAIKLLGASSTSEQAHIF